MQQTTAQTDATAKTDRHAQEDHHTLAAGGLRMRTDLRAGLSWDDLDDQAQQLLSNLSSALSGLTGSADAS